MFYVLYLSHLRRELQKPRFWNPKRRQHFHTIVVPPLTAHVRVSPLKLALSFTELIFLLAQKHWCLCHLLQPRFFSPALSADSAILPKMQRNLARRIPLIFYWSWLEINSNHWFNRPSCRASTTLPMVAAPAVSAHVYPPRTDPTASCPTSPATCHPVTSLAQNEILWFELESKTQLLTRNHLCHALITCLNHRKLLSLSVGGEKNICFKIPERCGPGRFAWGYE